MDAAEAARAAGIVVYPLSRLTLEPANAAGGALLLGYSALDEQQIRDGVRRLAKALRTLAAE